MVKIVILRTVLAIATARHWHIYQLDVFNSFLQGYLEDDIYRNFHKALEFKGKIDKYADLLNPCVD